MRRIAPAHAPCSLPALLSAALLAWLAGAAPALAQRSTTRGLDLGFHLSAASLEVQDEEPSNAGGAGVFVGYGLNRNFMVFLQLDGAEFDVEDADVEGRWTMGHVDLGGRFHFASTLRRWVPYLQAALTARVVTVEDAVVEDRGETEVSFNGGSVSLGGGLLVYFSETLALDLQALFSGGEFTEIEVDNVTVRGLDIDAGSSRLSLGLSWWP